jgi:hypothetical protein
MMRGHVIEIVCVLRRACWRALEWTIAAECRLRGERRPRIVVVQAPERYGRPADKREQWN